MASDLTGIFQEQNERAVLPSVEPLRAYARSDFGAAADPKKAQEWNANATSQTELLARQGNARSVEAAHRRERREKDNTGEWAAEIVQQALERFQDTYTEAMAFYDDADARLNTLEARIKGQIHDIESNTGLLESKNGAAVYQDENGGFYTLRNGQRTAITGADEIDDLRRQVREIKAGGRTVRTEEQQATLKDLMVMLTDVMDLKGDVRDNRDEAKGLKEEVDADSSKAPDAEKTIREKQRETEGKIKELERKVDGLDAKGNQADQQHTVDAGPEASTIAEWKASAPGHPPSTGLDF